MVTILLQLVLSILKSDAVHALVSGLLDHLVAQHDSPLDQAGAATIKDILAGKVNVTVPTDLTSAVQDVAAVAGDAVDNYARIETEKSNH